MARVVLAAVLAVLLLALPVAPASAAAASASGVASQPTRAGTVSPRVERTVQIKIVRRDGGLRLVGKVTPRSGKVVVQRATSCTRRTRTCDWSGYRTVRPDDTGRFRVRVHAPAHGSWAWRARAGRTASDAWLTCTKQARGDSCPLP
ncbi:MAG: hypothetical protein CMH83_00830 [Nocardioides sp.]|nr:hypothetical protein [Nocardioides sp.]